MQKKTSLLALIGALGFAVAGCGSGKTATTTSSATSHGQRSPTAGVNPNAKEKSPPGDIPDSTQFVRFPLPGGGCSVKVPEGWSRTGGGKRVTFTSNLNSVTIESRRATGPLTVSSARKTEAPALAAKLSAFKLQSVEGVRRSGQRAVRIKYLAKSAPNAVTGKALTDAAEQYLLVHNGTEAVLTLAGPKGADNVDPWRTVSDSVRWSA